jgi:hypothetical protein
LQQLLWLLYPPDFITPLGKINCKTSQGDRLTRSTMSNDGSRRAVVSTMARVNNPLNKF